MTAEVECDEELQDGMQGLKCPVMSGWKRLLNIAYRGSITEFDEVVKGLQRLHGIEGTWQWRDIARNMLSVPMQSWTNEEGELDMGFPVKWEFDDGVWSPSTPLEAAVLGQRPSMTRHIMKRYEVSVDQRALFIAIHLANPVVFGLLLRGYRQRKTISDARMGSDEDGDSTMLCIIGELYFRDHAVEERIYRVVDLPPTSVFSYDDLVERGIRLLQEMVKEGDDISVIRLPEKKQCLHHKANTRFRSFFVEALRRIYAERAVNFIIDATDDAVLLNDHTTSNNRILCPLHMAIVHRQISTVKLLIDRGLDVTSTPSPLANYIIDECHMKEACTLVLDPRLTYPPVDRVDVFHYMCQASAPYHKFKLSLENYLGWRCDKEALIYRSLKHLGISTRLSIRNQCQCCIEGKRERHTLSSDASVARRRALMAVATSIKTEIALPLSLASASRMSIRRCIKAMAPHLFKSAVEGLGLTVVMSEFVVDINRA